MITFTLVVIGNLMMPVELHSEDACDIAAKRISRMLQATVLCIAPTDGTVIRYVDGKIDNEI